MIQPSEITKRIGIAFTFVGVFVNGAISLWIADSSNKFKEKQEQINSLAKDKEIENARFQASINSSLEYMKINITGKEHDLSKLKFISELLPKTLSGDKAQKDAFLALMQITLDPPEYNKLIEALSASPSSDAKQLGLEGEKTIFSKDANEREEIDRLIQSISSKTKSDRLKAMDQIYRKYSDNSNLILLLINYLESNFSKEVDENGRINAIYALIYSKKDAWNAALINAGLVLVEKMETSTLTPPVGRQAQSLLADLKKKLSSLKNNL